MPERVQMADAAGCIGQLCRKPAPIAIDGLPCAGKSTLADHLKRSLDAECIHLDDFVLPESEWPPARIPAFPFSFIRYDAFLTTVTALATTGACSFHPFDWHSLAISQRLHVVRLEKPVIIEGVSALHPLSHHFALKVFLESDRATSLQAALERGAGGWEREWREFFMPSVDIYMRTQPEKRADLLVAGRGLF
jgi:uridine kinase